MAASLQGATAVTFIKGWMGRDIFGTLPKWRSSTSMTLAFFPAPQVVSGYKLLDSWRWWAGARWRSYIYWWINMCILQGKRKGVQGPSRKTACSTTKTYWNHGGYGYQNPRTMKMMAKGKFETAYKYTHMKPRHVPLIAIPCPGGCACQSRWWLASWHWEHQPGRTSLEVLMNSLVLIFHKVYSRKSLPHKELPPQKKRVPASAWWVVILQYHTSLKSNFHICPNSN